MKQNISPVLEAKRDWFMFVVGIIVAVVTLAAATMVNPWPNAARDLTGATEAAVVARTVPTAEETAPGRPLVMFEQSSANTIYTDWQAYPNLGVPGLSNDSEGRQITLDMEYALANRR